MAHQKLINDALLLQGVLAGDRKAFDELYDRYWQVLYERAICIVRVSQDAQDVVQDVFLSVWKRKDSLRIETSISAYLLTAVKFRSLAYIRDNVSRKNHLAEVAASLALPAAQKDSPELQVRETESRIAAAVSQMPDRMQVIYRLSRQEALSHKEIALHLKIEESTVKKQVRNALIRIRSSLFSFFL